MSTNRGVAEANAAGAKNIPKQPNLSEPLQLHFVLAEEQLHLLQLLLQLQVLLQQPEVQLEHKAQRAVRY